MKKKIYLVIILSFIFLFSSSVFAVTNIGDNITSGGNLTVDGKGVFIDGLTVGTYNLSSGLKLDVEGKVGAQYYCDQNGGNCHSISQLASGSGSQYLNDLIDVSTSGVLNGSVLSYDSNLNRWVPGNISITGDNLGNHRATQNLDLNGYNLLNADNLNINNWNQAYTWGNHASAGYLTSLAGKTINDLGDIDVSGVNDGEFLRFNASLGKWTPQQGAGVGDNLGNHRATQNLDLNGYNLLNAANLNISNWNQAFVWGNHASAGYLTSLAGKTINDLGDIDVSGADDGEVLKFNASLGKWTAQADNVSSGTGNGFRYEDCRFIDIYSNSCNGVPGCTSSGDRVYINLEAPWVMTGGQWNTSNFTDTIRVCKMIIE